MKLRKWRRRRRDWDDW